jgi:polyisoprenoid-binding protein YceI
MTLRALSLLAIAASATAAAATETYNIDPNHTHPTIETDHFGGLSVWRGVFKTTGGTVTLDRASGTGKVSVTIDTKSIDLANDKLNEHVTGPEVLDTAKYPTATYEGTLGGFKNGAPTTVTGNLTLHGVTKPVSLTIDSFKCVPDMQTKKQRCGADAKGTFNRADFGVNFGDKYGFKMDVGLLIQVEALKAD